MRLPMPNSEYRSTFTRAGRNSTGPLHADPRPAGHGPEATSLSLGSGTRAIAQDSETIATPDQLVCVLTPEQTEGP